MDACEASPGLPEALLHVAAALEAVGTCSTLPKVILVASGRELTGRSSKVW